MANGNNPESQVSVHVSQRKHQQLRALANRINRKFSDNLTNLTERKGMVGQEAAQGVKVGDENIVGGAYGVRLRRGQIVAEPVIVVYVAEKLPEDKVDPNSLAPEIVRGLNRNKALNGIGVDVMQAEMGELYGQEK